ncbi:MAG: glycosyltransferase family 4 protein [Phycisphaerales bacterium]
MPTHSHPNRISTSNPGANCPASNTADPETDTLRVGFICAQPLHNAQHQSGMPHNMALALQHAGCEIIELTLPQPSSTPPPPHRRATRRIKWEITRRTPFRIKRAAQSCFPGLTYHWRRRVATARSNKIQLQIDSIKAQRNAPDIYFLCCDQSLLIALDIDAPICYFSDATFPILRDTYKWWPIHTRAYFDAMLRIEKAVLSQVNTCVFSSQTTLESAINDLGIPAQRTHVVPMGANVTPDDPASITAPTNPPTRDDCQLLIIAADPVRKRVDLALEAARLLRHRGINATLHIVGPGTKACQNNPAAQLHGRLKLSDPADRHTHQQLLRDSHIQLLPSLGEAFGIAPIESAHFARPSIVSNAGGLPFVVLHNQTGLVIDTDAPASAWADAIESLIDDPKHYKSMSTAALTRARAELNWNAWGESVAKIIRDTVANHA